MEFDVTLDLLRDMHELQDRWLDLQRRATPSFFLTWSWIGCWLEHSGARPMVLEARHDNKVMALALLQTSAHRSQGRFPAKCLYLHETGEAEKDRLTIEYNGILADATMAPQAIKACIEFLLHDENHGSTWDELYLSGVDPHYANLFEDRGRLKLIPRARSSAAIDLDTIRGSGKPYLDSLSSNTRYQVRRAIRLYEKAGEIRITPAANTETAMTYLDELKPLHIEYWAARGSRSGFAEPFFTAFHETLITRGISTGEIELLRITAGTRLVGYLYNFSYNREIYFYLSALNYEDDPKLKPGLVSHALSAQYYLDKGLAIYDFMAGDARYKSSLGNSTGELYWLIIQRKRPKFFIEDSLRLIKHKMEGISKMRSKSS